MRISDWSSDVCSSDLPGEKRIALARPLNLQKLEPGQEAFRVIRRFCSFGCNFVPEFFQKGTFKPQHALIADQPVRPVRLDHLRGEPLPVPPGEPALEVIVEKLRRTGAQPGDVKGRGHSRSEERRGGKEWVS